MTEHRIRSRPEPNRPPRMKSVPEPSNSDVPPRPGEEVPTTAKGNYPRLIVPREKPKGYSANLVGETPYDRERGTPHTMGGSFNGATCFLVMVILLLLAVLILVVV